MVGYDVKPRRMTYLAFFFTCGLIVQIFNHVLQHTYCVLQCTAMTDTAVYSGAKVLTVLCDHPVDVLGGVASNSIF